VAQLAPGKARNRIEFQSQANKVDKAYDEKTQEVSQLVSSSAACI
jgi:uncharacterized membrane-anchored protein YhcB (DUF1043 family)